MVSFFVFNNTSNLRRKHVLRIALPAFAISVLFVQWYVYTQYVPTRVVLSDRVLIYQTEKGLVGDLMLPEPERPGDELAQVTFWWFDRTSGWWAPTKRQRGMVMGFMSYSDQLAFNSNGSYTQDDLSAWLYQKYPDTQPVVETAWRIVESAPTANLTPEQLQTPAWYRPRPLGDLENLLSLIMLGVILFAAISALIRFAQQRKHTPGLCPSCGYSLTGLPSPTCPECGHVSGAA